MLASLLAVAAAVPLLVGPRGPLLDDAAAGRDDASVDRLHPAADLCAPHRPAVGRSTVRGGDGPHLDRPSHDQPGRAGGDSGSDPGPSSGSCPDGVGSGRAGQWCGGSGAGAGEPGARHRDFFDHDNPDGIGPFDRADAAGATNARAENIAQGRPDAASVMNSWLNSPGHRRNVLDCSYRTTGLGVAR